MSDFYSMSKSGRFSKSVGGLLHLLRFRHWPKYGMDLTGTGACNRCWDLTDQ